MFDSETHFTRLSGARRSRRRSPRITPTDVMAIALVLVAALLAVVVSLDAYGVQQAVAGLAETR